MMRRGFRRRGDPLAFAVGGANYASEGNSGDGIDTIGGDGPDGGSGGQAGATAGAWHFLGGGRGGGGYIKPEGRPSSPRCSNS